MSVKPTLSLTFFIIFTNTENTSSMSIPFILKEFISSWISLIQSLGSSSSKAQLFLNLTIWCFPVILFSRGSTISSGGYCSPYSRPLGSFTSSSSHVALASSYSSSPTTSSSEALLGNENFTLLVSTPLIPTFIFGVFSKFLISLNFFLQVFTWVLYKPQHACPLATTNGPSVSFHLPLPR